MDVPALLRASMAAHARNRHLRVVTKQPEEATTALREARDLRMQAHTLDPDHVDALWTTPVGEGALKGVHLHDDLMRFYQQQLGDA